jgi:hypothetical protein
MLVQLPVPVGELCHWNVIPDAAEKSTTDRVKGVVAPPAIGTIDAVPGVGVPVQGLTPSPTIGKIRAVAKPPPDIVICDVTLPTAVGRNLTYNGTAVKPGNVNEYVCGVENQVVPLKENWKLLEPVLTVNGLEVI